MERYNKYLDIIPNEDDQVLISEAINVIGCGQYRAAYILIWLSCVESLKRRFFEAGKRDSNAGNVNKNIIALEKQHKATDMFILEESKKYGFITDCEYSKLEHIYTMRCIYAHPYEEKPSEEDLASAISNVVNIVLSQQVILKEGFISNLIRNLINDRNFLDNYRATVDEYASEIIQKVDPKKYEYFIRKYWLELDSIATNPAKKVELQRGIWFSIKVLDEIGCKFLKPTEWHDFVTLFQYIPSIILLNKNFFPDIGIRTQDYLLSATINLSTSSPGLLGTIGVLFDENLLTTQQANKFQDYIESLEFSVIQSSNLSINFLFEKIIEKLKSYNWYIQQPVMDFIRNKNIAEIRLLSRKKQEILGRNIYQVADGREDSANEYITQISRDPNLYPYNFIKGIVFEAFINEDEKIRYKNSNDNIFDIRRISQNYNSREFNRLIDELKQKLNAGVFKQERNLNAIQNCEVFNGLEWSKEIFDIFEKKYQLNCEQEESI